MVSIKFSCLIVGVIILYIKFSIVAAHDRSEPHPTGYDVTLRAHTVNMTFDGEVIINVQTVRKERKIKLNSQNLIIKTVNVKYAGEMLIRESHEAEYEDERLTIDVGNLLAGNHTIEIGFEGRINDRSVGLFTSKCYSTTPTMIGGATLEPINARAVFPSFDDNERQIPLNISVMLNKLYNTVTPKYGLSRSERLVQNIQLSFDAIHLDQVGWAFYPNDQTVREISYDGHLVVTCRSNMMTTLLQNLVKEMNEYYSLKLTSSQWILMPNLPQPFVSSKNIIFVREHLMENSSYTNTMDVSENLLTVIEAFASQLFGQTITVSSWSSIWLNKGLAKFTSYKLADKLYDGFHLESYIIGNILPKVLEREIIPHSLSKHAHSKKEILSMLDQDLYEKAGLVFRMIEDKVGEHAFKRALSHFVNKTISKGVATPNDLWDSLKEHSMDFPPGVEVEEVMKSWINSAGYPVVNVRRENDYLYISQDSVVKDIKYTPEGVGYWWVPIVVTSQSIRGSRKFWLRPKDTLRVNLPLNDNWYMINENGKGLYRVNYDMENWKNLSEAIERGELKGMGRARVLDDSLGLAENGRLPYKVALELTKHLYNEFNGCPRYMPWSASVRHFINIRTLMETSSKDYFDEYVSSLIESYILGNNVILNDNDSTENSSSSEYQIQNATDIEKMLIKLSQVKELCRDNQYCNHIVKHIVTTVLENGVATDNIIDVVGCLNIERGSNNDSLFEDWLEIYRQYPSPTFEKKLIKGLSCLSSVHQRTKLLDMCIDESSGTQREDFINAIAAMSYSEKSVNEILDWMVASSVQLKSFLSGDTDMVSNIITVLSEKIFTNNALNKLQSVLPDVEEQTSQLVNNQKHRAYLRIEGNRKRRETNRKEILDWFKNPDSRFIFSTASSNIFNVITVLILPTFLSIFVLN